jgi:hypothetical protein
MLERERQNKIILDQESWTWWFELEWLEEFIDPWCCRINKEGNFEEEVLNTLNEFFGGGIRHLKVNFCMHCGTSLEHNSEIAIAHENCCCKFSSLFEFAEVNDPRTDDIHRLKGNFCFNCGKEISKISPRN